MEKLKALQRLEESLNKLPSVGRKSAERLAFAMLDMDESDLQEFADSVSKLKESIHICPICGNLTEEDVCSICKDESRDKSTIMVVSTPKDILALEKGEDYRGLYHVLGGTISLTKGKGIEDLKIPELLERIQSGNVKEVIIATNPTVDGETTALYLAKIIEPLNITVTRIAYGLPMGGNLDYTDSLTISKAIEGRRKI
ncbi:MAG: recombination mediator RecR [Bacilli bacterium]|nr:recombination mediator RecR [Bacilli bacterium]